MADAAHCEGAPRDLGFDQGRACADLLRAARRAEGPARRALQRLGRTHPATRRVLRDVRRHFPHQAESLEGLARGAGVPLAFAADALAGACAPDGEEALPSAGAVAGVFLARSLPPSAARRLRVPEGGLRSAEIFVPSRTAAVAGVNESGLAGAVVPGGPVAPGSCAAPGALLLQDALERLGTVEAALSWCTGRPGGGRATLLFADARRELAAVEIRGDAREVRRPAGSVLAAGGADPDAVKALCDASRLDAPRVAAALRGPVVVLDPAGRRLALVAPGSDAVDWLAL